MQELKLPAKCKETLTDFIARLKDAYKEELVSVILYGSAASGEFVSEYSNLNVLVVLKNTELSTLAKASSIVHNPRFKVVQPLFFTEEYITSSLDVFPIEFLDISENYAVLTGADILKNIAIDTRNLRFQCEHELKAKLINLRQVFVGIHKNSSALKEVLLKSFTSIAHIARNVIRLRGKQPGYLKQDIIKQLSEELSITSDTWNKILILKNKEISITSGEVERLFISFVEDLEKIIALVDAS
jgi:predicted nucleotidyltransferase